MAWLGPPLHEAGREFFTFNEQVIFERDEFLTPFSKPYTVFTPHKNARLGKLTPLKDLGIDWRRGERLIVEHPNDLDFASNHGGWQWAGGVDRMRCEALRPISDHAAARERTLARLQAVGGKLLVCAAFVPPASRKTWRTRAYYRH
jgi:deoxyribodipyrimidine photolyase